MIAQGNMKKANDKICLCELKGALPPSVLHARMLYNETDFGYLKGKESR